MFSRQTAKKLRSVVIDTLSRYKRIDKPASRGRTNLMAVGTVFLSQCIMAATNACQYMNI